MYIYICTTCFHFPFRRLRDRESRAWCADQLIFRATRAKPRAAKSTRNKPHRRWFKEAEPGGGGIEDHSSASWLLHDMPNQVTGCFEVCCLPPSGSQSRTTNKRVAERWTWRRIEIECDQIPGQDKREGKVHRAGQVHVAFRNRSDSAGAAEDISRNLRIRHEENIFNDITHLTVIGDLRSPNVHCTSQSLTRLYEVKDELSN